MNESGQTEPWRIATVWAGDWMQAPDMLDALYRWVDVTGTPATLRYFRTEGLDFRRQVMTPLKHWMPHGVVLRYANWDHVRRLRRLLPGVPFVATMASPPDAADTCIVIDLAEALTMAINHLRSRGAASLALYYSGARLNADRYLAAFRTVAPDGLAWVYPDEDQPKGEAHRVRRPGHRYELVYPEHREATEKIRCWLQSLPKPAGVVTLEIGAAGFLLAQCRAAGLRVPKDVQLIGADDTRVSLSFEPHLTSLAMPRARIGEVAMATILRYLRGERPPPAIEVRGTKIVARGSTGLAPIGAHAVASSLKLLQTKKARGASAMKIAQLSGVGRSTLYRQFVAATGESPARHFRKIRMEEAGRRLREGMDNVTDIAEACGFGSLQAFTRAFHRETGLTPTAFRKKAQREDKRR